MNMNMNAHLHQPSSSSLPSYKPITVAMPPAQGQTQSQPGQAPVHSDEQVFHATFLKLFTKTYNLDPSLALSLYGAAPNNFVTFAVLCPGPAFLLERLQHHYRHLTASLALFSTRYPSAVRVGDADPFGYFCRETLKWDHKDAMLQLRAALADRKRAYMRAENVEIAKDVLDFIEDGERREIVRVLCCERTAVEIASVVPVNTDVGIWHVRFVIGQREKMLQANARHLREKLDAIEENDKERERKLKREERKKNRAGGGGRGRDRPRRRYFDDDYDDMGFRFTSRSRSRSPFAYGRRHPHRREYWSRSRDSSPSSSTIESVEFIDDEALSVVREPRPMGNPIVIQPDRRGEDFFD